MLNLNLLGGKRKEGQEKKRGRKESLGKSEKERLEQRLRCGVGERMSQVEF